MDIHELEAGYKAFQEHEPRDAMYKTATFLVEHFWGKPCEMADSLGVLLLTWNQAFYRYGLFDYDALERCIERNQRLLEEYRDRDILSHQPDDDSAIDELYGQFLEALQIADGTTAGRQSPVAVAKALHLLGPAYFPLWDDKIARAYGCHYKYLPFLRQMKALAASVASEIDVRSTGKTLLKLIDEYNYSKFTRNWI